MLSILTVNIGAAARERAEVMLRWLAGRPEDVFLLTETSGGAGTAYLLERFRDDGYAVAHTPDVNGDRGTALVSRIAVAERLTTPSATVSVPGRVAAVVLDTEPAVAVLGVYVPSRDRSAGKTENCVVGARHYLARFNGAARSVRLFVFKRGNGDAD